MDKRNAIINQNIDYGSLVKTNLFKEYITPSTDSKLIHFSPNFLDKMASGEVKTITRSELPKGLDFNVQTNLNATIFFGELLRIAIAKGYPTSTVKGVWGFDVDHLPDIPYLLSAIAVWDSSSPFIKCLPKLKPVTLNAFQQALDQEKVTNMLNRLAVGEKFTTTASGLDFAEIKPNVAEAANIYSAYYFTKFKLVSTRNDAQTLLNKAIEYPAIKALLQEGNTLKLLNSRAFGLEEDSRSIAKAIAADRTMQIEGILPGPADNRLPFELQEQEKERLEREEIARHKKRKLISYHA